MNADCIASLLCRRKTTFSILMCCIDHFTCLFCQNSCFHVCLLFSCTCHLFCQRSKSFGSKSFGLWDQVFASLDSERQTRQHQFHFYQVLEPFSCTIAWLPMATVERKNLKWNISLNFNKFNNCNKLNSVFLKKENKKCCQKLSHSFSFLPRHITCPPPLYNALCIMSV